MTGKQLPAIGSKTFEALKQTNEHDAEYWSARDLQPLLGYSQWRRFEQAIERAITSCRESGNNPDYHFAGAGKPIPGGKGAVQVVQDYQLSRFACYLIAQAQKLLTEGSEHKAHLMSLVGETIRGHREQSQAAAGYELLAKY